MSSTENFACVKDIFDSCQSHLLRTIIANQAGIVCRAPASEKLRILRIVALSIVNALNFSLTLYYEHLVGAFLGKRGM